MTPKYTWGLVGVVVGFFVAMALRGCNVSPFVGYREVVRYDTIPQLIVQPPVIIRAPGRVVRISDTQRVIVYVDSSGAETVLNVPDFVACIDSTVQGDTAHVCFHSNGQFFDIELKKKPIVVDQITKTIEREIPVPDSERWGISVCVGYAWGAEELTSGVPLLSPQNIRVGLMGTFDLIKW